MITLYGDHVIKLDSGPRIGNFSLIAKEFARIHSATPKDIEITHGNFEEIQDPFVMMKKTHRNLPTSYTDPIQDIRLVGV